MNQAVGRAIAAVGVVLGIVAIFLEVIDTSFASIKYSDDGTVLAFLLVTLIVTALLLAVSFAGRASKSLDAAALVVGSLALGFSLFFPATLGFDHFDFVGAGGWLGLCTGLIPLGLGYSLVSAGGGVTRPSPDAAALPIIGRIMLLIGIWTTAVDGGPSYWNFSESGHALGLLMLLLVVVGAALGAATTFVSTHRATADWTLILAAVTAGLYWALMIGNAFDTFGAMDVGSWLGAAGGLVLLVGVARLWSVATAEVPASARQDAPAAVSPA